MANCVVNEYSAFVPPNLGGLAVDGVQTQGENIADNGGKKFSFLYLNNIFEVFFYTNLLLYIFTFKKFAKNFE